MSDDRQRLCIALVSDFFYPDLGGVELHIYQLAQGLIGLGHKVIVITGTYPSRPPNPTILAPGSSPPQHPGIRKSATQTSLAQQDESGDGKAKVERNSSQSFSHGENDPDHPGHHRDQDEVGESSSKPFLSERQGVRYMVNGLKVYYCPQMRFHQQIVLREKVDIVHGHQTTSSLAHECLHHAKTMGLRTVYTDHSLFGFASSADIHLNKIMKFTCADINHVICVSNISRENLVLRAFLSPERVSVIPNAVDVSRFTPDPSASPDFNKQINIIVMSRLVYRKGIDLLVDVIPEVCRRFPQVHFLIGGSGPKRLILDEMREKHGLQDRVEFLGSVPHDRVRDVLVQGHIFLNCSLTEAFCIAILEAVSAGLYVVSTRVGGVPEVLPESMISFAEPDPQDLIEVLSNAIPEVKNLRPLELHKEVAAMYNWQDVARRTLEVYRMVMAQEGFDVLDRLNALYPRGTWSGKLFCGVVAVDWLLLKLLEWKYPNEYIDIAPDFPALVEPK